MQLYDYQLSFVDAIQQSFRRGNKRVIGNAVTGFGKTIVAAYITKKAIERDKVVCILVHREEILDQFITALAKFKIYPSLIVPGSKPMAGNKCYLGMVETFSRRMTKGSVDHLGINFFIPDEIHWGSYPKVINQVNCHVLGLTGTPKSTGKPELNELFDDLVMGASVQQLIDLGRLCRGETFSVKYDFSKVKKRGKDFEDKALIAEFKKANLYDGAVDKYFELAANDKAICYCVNIQHALDVVNSFKERGIKNLYYVDGADCFELNTQRELIQTERKEAISKYKASKDAVLVNVGVATTGFDCPDVSCIITNFSTMSITKYHQCIGRGARACEGKDHFKIIDMGRNYARHKRFGQYIDWLEIFNQPAKLDAKREEKARKVERECDECGYVMPIKNNCCPNCNHVYTPKEVELAMLQGAAMEQIREYRLDSMPVHLRRPINKLSLIELREYGKYMGYKPMWANIIYNKLKQ